MKKQLLLAAFAALVTSASAQTTVDLIAGFNFGPLFNATNSPSLDGINPIGSISNNFRENISTSVRGLQAVSPETSQFSNATLYFDGTNGSDAWLNNVFPSVAGSVITSLAGAGPQSSINLSTVYGGSVRMNTVDTSNARLRFDASASINTFSIVADTSAWLDYNPADFAYNNDNNFSFAAQAIGSPATITWLFNGSAIAGATFNVGTTQTAFNFDLPTAFYGDNDAQLTAVVSGTLLLDNVQINGVAIPEPSSFAALAGLMGLGLAASRRRRG
jgi:hypothetical protein